MTISATQLEGMAEALFSAKDSNDQATVRRLALGSNSVYCYQKAAADAMASTTSDVALEPGKLPFQIKVLSAAYLPEAACTANGTNFATVSLAYNDGTTTSSSETTVASITTASVSWVANVPVVLTLTAANVIIPISQVLHFVIAKAASGVVVPAGSLVVLYEAA